MSINKMPSLLKPVVLAGFILLSSDVRSQSGKDILSFSEDQLVMVMQKDGKELPARITSVSKNKKKHWVRMISDNRLERVHRKFLRAMEKAEALKIMKSRLEAKTRS